MRKFSTAEANNHFGDLIDATRIQPVPVTKCEKPLEAALGVTEYERAMAFADQIPLSRKTRPKTIKRKLS